MKYVRVRYRVLLQRVAEVGAALGPFLRGIRKHEPGTLFYFVFEEDDGTFIHVMGFKSERAEQAHKEAQYSIDFLNTIVPLCRGEVESGQIDSKEVWLRGSKPALSFLTSFNRSVQ